MPKRKNPKSKFKNISTRIFTVLLVLLIVSGFFAISSGGFQQSENITFSQLADSIKDDKVAELTIQGTELKLTLEDGTKQIAHKEEGVSFFESLQALGVTQEQLQGIKVDIKSPSRTAFLVSTALSVILPILLIGGLLWYMMSSAKKGQMQALQFGKSKAKQADWRDKKKTTFDSVAGLDEAKEELKEVVDFLKNPRKYLEIGAKIPKGMLLVGPAGTGKTLLARAVAGEANVPFYHAAGSEFVEMFVGVGSSRIRDLFQTAKQNAPALVFIDEIDAVGRQRGAGLGGGHDEREQTLNQILAEMDGFDERTNVVVIAATNRPDVLDPALLRPGRFDRKVVADLPDIKARRAILELHAKDKKFVKNISMKEVAERTPGFSGADLENLLNEAAIEAVQQGKKKIGQRNLNDAIEKVMLGRERKNRVLSPQEKKIAAFHEAGHALVSHFLPHTDPVRKISIISRGQAGGFTLTLPEEENYFASRSKYMDQLATMLGGYSAEEETFNEVTTGASDDLKKVSQLARNLVTKYGMSKLGPIAFGDQDDHVFLGKEIGESRNYSEETAAEIDQEIRHIIKTAYQSAQKVIQEQQEVLEKVANTLLEKETLERKDFEAIVGKNT